MYPILFRIGPLEIRSYGVMVALAFLAATSLGVKEAKRRGLNPDLVHDFLLYAMIFGIVGARLYYIVFSDPTFYLSHPSEIPAIWKGGIAVHGGILGGLLAGIWFTKKRGISFWQFGDLLAPSLILGQAVGRGACTLNGCSFGRPTDLPWAIVFTNPDAMAPKGVPLHPTQFYELAINFILFFLIYGYRTRTTFTGQLFLLYLMSYGVARFFIEFFRGDSLMFGEGIRMAQVTSLTVLIVSVSLFFIIRKKPFQERIMGKVRAGQRA